MSEAMLYSLLASIECYQDAGYAFDPLNPTTSLSSTSPNWEMGAIIGNTNNGMEYLFNTVVPSFEKKEIKRMGIAAIEKTMTSGVSAKVAGILGLGNKVSTNSSACSTGTDAIIDGFFHIKSGRATAMLCGGAEGGAPYQWSGFDAMRLINSKFNDAPTKSSRPFSESSNTFIPGEGAGIVMLESLASAKKRQAKIYAEILSGVSNCGAQREGGSMTAPNSNAIVRAIKEALAQANISSEKIDYINGHLTGTFGDTLEMANWQKALGLSFADFPYINGTKALIGHALSAAGAIETVATIVQMQRGFIHPAINSEDLYPELASLRTKIPLTTLETKIEYAIKASFGFGDVNAILLLKNWRKDV